MSPIRKATKKDAKAILAIKNKARQDGYQKIVDQAYLDSLDISDERLHKFQQWIEKCDIFLVYEEKDNILGFIC
ncbi:hypothetical protein FACS189428_1530 [Clostridia bacterium]|nr:hypothetical protein FACS189428_1530 [Clostridia bacterium]